MDHNVAVGLFFIFLAIATVVSVIGTIALKIWRVVTFAKLMKISVWKAYWLLGK